MWYKSVARPLLFRMDPENAHELTFSMAERLGNSTLMRRMLRFMAGKPANILSTSHFGVDFPSPIGTAAGFDKNARLTHVLPSLGFGFMEIGSATALPSKGNSKPRLFRLPQDQALINRMGLNNDGAEALAKKLMNVARFDVPLGINIAKTHDPRILGDAAVQDYATSVRLLAPYASYIALNVSCPNTEEGKTFEDLRALKSLLSAIETEKPVLVKFSADITKKALIPLIDICETYGVAGYVAVNTSLDRSSLITPVHKLEVIGKGGLSGRPLKSDATRLLRLIRDHTAPERTIISVGGISTVEDVIERLSSGADLVQLYTALIYEGPMLVARLNRRLADWLHLQGTTLSDFIKAVR